MQVRCYQYAPPKDTKNKNKKHVQQHAPEVTIASQQKLQIRTLKTGRSTIEKQKSLKFQCTSTKRKDIPQLRTRNQTT